MSNSSLSLTSDFQLFAQSKGLTSSKPSFGDSGTEASSISNELSQLSFDATTNDLSQLPRSILASSPTLEEKVRKEVVSLRALLSETTLDESGSPRKLVSTVDFSSSIDDDDEVDESIYAKSDVPESFKSESVIDSSVSSVGAPCSLVMTNLSWKDESFMKWTIEDDGGTLTGQYTGQVSNGGIPHGIGTLFFHNGDQYEGQFAFGRMSTDGHTKAIYRDATGIYKGDFLNNRREGLGEFTSSTRRYVGKFQDGQQHGPGTLFYLDGSVDYEGQWVFGKPLLDFVGHQPQMSQLLDELFDKKQIDESWNGLISSVTNQMQA